MRKIPLATVLAITLLSTNALALKLTSSASVDIVEPVAFNEAQVFGDSGVVERPDAVIRKTIKNKQSSVQDLPERQYNLTGSKTDSVQIKVSSGGDTGGVKVDDFVVKYKDGKVVGNGVGQSAPGKNTTIKLAGKLKVDGEARPGYHNPSFEIAVYYE